MKKFICAVVLLGGVSPSFAVTQTAMARRSMAEQMTASPRATTLSKNQINAMGDMNAAATVDKSSIRQQVDIPASNATNGDNNADKDKREKERAACLGNNIGIGNTFVWASRYSNTNNYASMVEDTDNPENNTCFVKVELRSDDPKISVADIPTQYYEMGRDITCGEWADESKIEKRILDAKKSGRTWGTVGGVVGGVGIGVGMMELFGNEAIGGKVEGQKNKKLNDNERLRSQLLAEKDSDDYKNFMRYMRVLRDECERTDIKWANGKPEECKEYDYNYFLNL